MPANDLRDFIYKTQHTQIDYSECMLRPVVLRVLCYSICLFL